MVSTTQSTARIKQLKKLLHLQEDNARLQRLAEHFEDSYKSARASGKKAEQIEPLKERISELEQEVLGLKSSSLGHGTSEKLTAEERDDIVNHERWTDEEVQFLLDRYRSAPVETIAKELNRSLKSVAGKAQRMGMPYKSRYRGEAGEAQVVVKPAKTIPTECVGCVWFVDDTAFGFCPFGAGCAKDRLV